MPTSLDDDREEEDHEEEVELHHVAPHQHLLSQEEADDVGLLENGHLPSPGPAPSSHQSSAQRLSASPLPHLDGLRGTAAFMVYMSHWIAYWCAGETRANITKGFGYQGSNYAFTTLPFVRVFFTGGTPAVAIFFVLSGYVLCRGPLRQIHDGVARKEVLRGLVGAGVRRPVRLFWPVVVVTLGFAVLLHAPLGLAPKVHWPEVQGTLAAEVWKWARETAVAFSPFVDSGPFGRWYPYDPPVWTIAVEFKGSVVVFAFMGVLCYVPVRWRIGVIVVTGLGFLAMYEWAMAMFIAGLLLVYNDLHGLDGGIGARLSKRAQSIIHHAAFFAGWYLLSQPIGMGDPEDALSTPGYYFLTSLTPPNYLSGNHKYWRFWEVPGAALFVYGVLRIKWLQALLGSRPIRYLGRVSFSFYLIHILVLWTVGDRVARLFGRIVPGNAEDPMWYDNRLPLPQFGPVGLQFDFVFTQVFFILPFTLLLSEIGTRLLDEPSVKMGKWIVGRIPWLSRDRAGR